MLMAGWLAFCTVHFAFVYALNSRPVFSRFYGFDRYYSENVAATFMPLVSCTGCDGGCAVYCISGRTALRRPKENFGDVFRRAIYDRGKHGRTSDAFDH